MDAMSDLCTIELHLKKHMGYATINAFDRLPMWHGKGVAMLQRNWRRPAVGWTGFAAVLLAVTAYNLLNTPQINGLGPDEQIVMMMTKELAAGRPVYVTFIDHYPPGVPFVGLLRNTALAGKAALDNYVEMACPPL
jgi:hypothetical protein